MGDIAQAVNAYFQPTKWHVTCHVCNSYMSFSRSKRKI